MEQLERRLQLLLDRLRCLEDDFELKHAREQKGLLFEAVARFVQGCTDLLLRSDSQIEHIILEISSKVSDPGIQRQLSYLPPLLVAFSYHEALTSSTEAYPPLDQYVSAAVRSTYLAAAEALTEPDLRPLTSWVRSNHQDARLLVDMWMFRSIYMDGCRYFHYVPSAKVAWDNLIQLSQEKGLDHEDRINEIMPKLIDVRDEEDLIMYFE
ncbi:hypothetical protein ARMSODRAFT_1088848 [Armillaria solidipes]|uniref:Uncharacterized protein n=1 Tax=Armillaria solidipes TaxID=1076256 RepID=A0A2H3BAH9_9AGAR|nr:hypothetical protein ARMSODRAFT_1088848 [Armillaria solidipes]